MLGALLSFAAVLSPQGSEADAPVGVTIVVVAVGQGDGIVVRAPDGQVHVIDAGPPGAGTAFVLPVVDGLQPQSYGYTFLTHYHDDHMGGMDEVLARPFQLACDRGDLRRLSATPSMTSYLAAAGARRTSVLPGDTFQLGGGATLEVVAVDGHVLGGAFVDPLPSAQEENSRSVALKLVYGDFAMWLGGDLTGGASSTVDVETPAALACGDVEVYKLDHHGSTTSSNQNLVSLLAPELAVVSCGAGNSYGHPNSTVVNRLNQAAAARALFSTTTGSANTIGFGVTGDLRIDSDGYRYRATAANGDFLDFYCDEVPLPALQPGQVRISEVQRNPNLVPDTNGEYVEVENLGARPVSLRGLRLSDNGAAVTIASNFALVPGRPMLFQVDGAPSRNGGQPMGMALPYASLSLGDTTDTVTIDQAGLLIDQVAYGSGFPGGAGVAAERVDLLAAASAGNFAAATTAYGPGDLGSPGRRNSADATSYPVLCDVSVQPHSFTVHGTALGQPWMISVLALSYATTPATPFLGASIPLAFDPLFQAGLGAAGAIDLVPVGGYRSMRVDIPNPNPVAGLTLYAAHIVIDWTTWTVPGVSAPVPFVLP